MMSYGTLRYEVFGYAYINVTLGYIAIFASWKLEHTIAIGFLSMTKQYSGYVGEEMRINSTTPITYDLFQYSYVPACNIFS